MQSVLQIVITVPRRLKSGERGIAFHPSLLTLLFVTSSPLTIMTTCIYVCMLFSVLKFVWGKLIIVICNYNIYFALYLTVVANVYSLSPNINFTSCPLHFAQHC
jgi:hypothetical protein